MKKVFSPLLAALLLLCTLAAQAQTTRRVNNTGISGTNIYATVDAAIAASAVGDVVQVEPSGTNYPDFTLNKNVTIVGPGYFLDPTQNAGLQANPLPASVGLMSVATGGENAYVAGLTIGTVNNYVSNFTIQRCSIGIFYMNVVNAPVTNINIKQCYISNRISQYNGTAVDNILITNCIINGFVSFPTNFNGGFFNNVVTGSVTMSNFFVASNYFANNISGGGNTLANNIGASTSFPTTNGNQASVPQNAVFVLAPGATAFDAWYQLKAGTNPARGTGQGGIDVGAFGGATPYKLSGIPAIPTIYQQSQAIVGNSLNVTLSTRSNN